MHLTGLQFYTAYVLQDFLKLSHVLLNIILVTACNNFWDNNNKSKKKLWFLNTTFKYFYIPRWNDLFAVRETLVFFKRGLDLDMNLRET